MPYPALPPEVPSPIATLPCQEARCSQPHSSVAPETPSIRVATTGTLSRPSLPETFAPEYSKRVAEVSQLASLGPARVVEFARSSHQSSAALLGEPVAVTTQPEPSISSQAYSVDASTQVDEFRASPREDKVALLKQPGTIALQPEPLPAPIPADSASAPLKPLSQEENLKPAQGEKALLSKLDRVLNLNYWQGKPTALKVTLRRLPSQPIPALSTAIPLHWGDRLTPSQVLRQAQAQTTPLPPSTLTIPLGEPTPAQPSAPSPQPPATPAPGAVPINPPNSGIAGVIELTADRQEYDEQQRVFTAEGRVLMRYQGALLDADRLQVNLVNRNAVAEGNVALTRGNQVLRGQRLDYNFVQGVGTVRSARGEIFLPTTDTDLEFPEGVQATEPIVGRPVSDRVRQSQPTGNINNPDTLSVGLGLGRDVSRVPGALPQGGAVRRLRFEADQIEFTPEGWVATRIQITNDPFSPPELVLRAERARLTRLSPLRDELRATRPRLVFDQRVAIPLISRVVLDRRRREPPIARIGFDNGERGGLFVERTFDVIDSNRVRLSLTPQIFVQQTLFDSNNPFDLANYGLKGKLTATLGPRTFVRGTAVLTSLDPDDFEDKLRASLRARQLVGDHTLAVEYSYRDRLFNGSLGFQTVQSSLGALLLSPTRTIGNTGINYRYQVGFQNISANTDRFTLLTPLRENDRINLSRFQTVVELSRGFTLWQGRALPATQTEGLRYSPFPLTPYVGLSAGLTGVVSAYTNGDTQNNLIGSVGIFGQFGNFSRPYLDYTAFNLTYIQFLRSGESPFLFDRAVDNRILTAGFTQQIYGPLRFGIQTSVNLDTRQSISTEYILEYSRRAYGITVRYNPILSYGSIGLRISDFNWTGGTEAFAGTDATPVEGGVIRRTEE